MQITMYIEDFKSNKNNWTLEINDNIEISIDNGYHIDNKSESERALVTSGLTFDFTIPYQISIEIDSCTNKNSELYYGIVWDMKNWGNYLMTIFFTDGRCSFGKMHNGEVETLVPGHRAMGINEGKASNKFDIVEGLDKIRIFVNHNVACSSPRDIPHTGNHIGFIVSSGTKIRVKRLSIDYDNYRITNFLKSHPLFKKEPSLSSEMSMDEFNKELDSARDLAEELADPLDERNEFLDHI